jgi:hypothetical protein
MAGRRADDHVLGRARLAIVVGARASGRVALDGSIDAR